MSQERIMITSPVVRIVQGDIYNPSTKDMKGALLVYKTGPDVGKPRVDYFLKTAIAKTPGHTHWAQGDFGKQIWATGTKLWNGNTSLFWKIEDGDDATPNIERKGKKNCDTEGWSGHWVMKFGGAFAPKLVHMVGGQALPLTEEVKIKCGDYVQVYFEVRSNNDATKPGLLYNAAAICFISGGKEIYTGPDVSAAGFGQAPMPANAEVRNFETAVADNGFSAPTPSIPHTSSNGTIVHVTPGPAPTIPVIPNVAFAGIVTPPPPPPAAPVRQLTALAQGSTYEQLIANGWTDALLVSQGLMLP